MFVFCIYVLLKEGRRGREEGEETSPIAITIVLFHWDIRSPTPRSDISPSLITLIVIPVTGQGSKEFHFCSSFVESGSVRIQDFPQKKQSAVYLQYFPRLVAYRCMCMCDWTFWRMDVCMCV